MAIDKDGDSKETYERDKEFQRNKAKTIFERDINPIVRHEIYEYMKKDLKRSASGNKNSMKRSKSGKGNRSIDQNETLTKKLNSKNPDKKFETKTKISGTITTPNSDKNNSLNGRTEFNRSGSITLNQKTRNGGKTRNS